MRFFIAMLFLFSCTGLCFAGTAMVPVAQAPMVAQTATTSMGCCGAITRQRVEWERRVRQVEQQVTVMVPQTKTVMREVVECIPHVVEEVVPVQRTCCEALTSSCCTGSYGVSSNSCCQWTEAEQAVFHAQRALALMIQTGTARPGEIRRAKRTLARLVVRLQDLKMQAISGVHR